MARANHSEQTVVGDVVIERLSGTTIPKALKPFVAQFKKDHGALRAAAAAAEKARANRDDVLGTINQRDGVLDALVLKLADTLVGAGVGNRKNPFTGLSPSPPSRIVNLAYAVEVKEVRALCHKLRARKPPTAVVKLVSRCEAAAKDVEGTLAKLSKPQLAYQEALGKRETVVVAWSQTFARLKKNAQAAWFDQPATYKAVFAPPEAVQARRATRRAKGKPGAPNGGGGSSVSSGSPPAGEGHP